MKRYWVNFDLETLMITDATQDLSKKGYTEVTEVLVQKVLGRDCT